MMKIAIAAALLILNAGSPAWAGEQDFVLINDTGYTINEVYVSPSRSDDWEEDVLSTDTLADGQRVNIRFIRSEDTCLWDMKAVYADGDTAEWTSFNLCKVSVISVRYDADTGKTNATYE